jgi:hypothetical protein
MRINVHDETNLPNSLMEYDPLSSGILQVTKSATDVAALESEIARLTSLVVKLEADKVQTTPLATAPQGKAPIPLSALRNQHQKIGLFVLD